jgi:hypothetical protein
MNSTVYRRELPCKWSRRARAIRDVRTILNLDDSNKQIGALLRSGGPALVARIGSTELRSTLRQEVRNGNSLDKLRFAVNGYGLPIWLRSQEEKLQKKSGFFPITKENVERFGDIYSSAIEEIDFLGSWIRGENAFEHLVCCPAVTTLGNLEPLNSETPWTEALRGKKVLVVHPFQHTIESQFERRADIFFNNRLVLPEFDLVTLRAEQTLAGEKSRFANWFDALNAMKKTIQLADYEIAIVGAGCRCRPQSKRRVRSRFIWEASHSYCLESWGTDGPGNLILCPVSAATGCGRTRQKPRK